MPVEDWHVEFVANAMREADCIEVRELNGLSPREALDVSLAQPGQHWTGLVDGVPVAIFGVVPVTLIGDAAAIWLLGTDEIVRHWREFARWSRVLMTDLLDRHPFLFNVVHVHNRVALRWLEWIGATFNQSGDRIYFEIRGE